jgi:beta-mannosidase
MKLNSDWKIQHYDVGAERDLEVASPEFIDYFWLPAKVPGDVHSTLIKANLIDDPFFGHNDLKCRWVEEKVWWYRTTFTFDEEVDKKDRLELIFEGLDTFATVYLNGVELGFTDNMFIHHSFDVTREIVKGKNTLAVKFDPVDVHVKDKVQYYWSGFSKQRIWTRKAQAHFGWDWGPRLVAVGIWGDVRLEKRTSAKIDHVFARTVTLSDHSAEIAVDIDVTRYNKKKEYELDVSLADITQRVALDGSQSKITMMIENPKLWWTHDLGDPHLYELQVTLLGNGEALDHHQSDFGIRTLEVQRINEKGEHAFTFVLNGEKIFVKGANWIPIDSFIGSVPDDRYIKLIEMAKDANMNMIRAWGGGIYEKDVFYETCNRLGILVWQDFMFACALYPDYNKNFMENVKREVISVVKRLRTHPSLAIWCGNNENDWLHEALASSGEIPHPFYGEKIYHELMPELLEELDPSRLFWPSSPYGGNDHNSRVEGDTHNWQVWHGNIEPRTFGEPQLVDYSVEGLSFKKYKEDNTKFSSEFGMHASSNRYTLKSNIPEDQFYWGSDEMAYRNKDVHQPKGILLMEGYTGVPTNMDEYIAYSMLTQAEGLKYGVEHYRRNKPDTSGALIWQLNDCWPGTSWSLIDYYLLPKASYFYARRFFSPILLTMDHDPGEDIKAWVVNDELTRYEDVLELAVYTFKGEKVFSGEWEVSVEKNSAAPVFTLSEKEALNGSNPSDVVMVLQSKGNKAEPNVYYFRDHKDIELPKAELQVTLDEKNQQVTITSDVFARMVTLEIDAKEVNFEDNFFDLLPNQPKTVKIASRGGQSLPWETLKVSSINNLSE